MAHTVHSSDSRVCREPSFPFQNHLSLGEIDRREAMAAYCRRLHKLGQNLSLSETWAWADLNRVPRRPPIYRTQPPGVA